MKKYPVPGVLAVLVLLLTQACGSSVIDSDLGALSCLPDDYKTFYYIKNFPRVKTIFDKSEFAEEMKDNYVYLDLKYKYTQSLDLFFVKLDFDLQGLFDRINKDLLIGFTKNSFFVVAALDYQSQLIYSLFNLLPDTYIQKSSIMGQEINSFHKNNEEVYFTFLNNYLVIAGERGTMSAILDSRKSKEVEEGKLLNSCSDEDVFIRTHMPPDYNPFDVLPDLEKISIKLNFNTFRAQLEAESAQAKYFTKPAEEYEYFQFLKYLPADFSLCFFNRTFEVGEVFRRIFSNFAEDSDYAYQAEKNIEELEVFKNFSDGGYFAFKNLGYTRRSSEVEPGMAFALQLKKGVSTNKLPSLMASVFRVFNFLFGFSGWDKTSAKNYTLYKCRDNDFYIITFERFFILCTNRDIMEDITGRIKSSQASLYDKLFDHFEQEKQDDLVFYMGIDMQSLFATFEPFFADYIQSELSMETGEYRNSFGQFLDFLKRRKPLFVTMQKTANYRMYTGEIKFIK
ncbi:MAG: hypothetical protein JW822_12190 [Spirochaetales bacterium]|nr:hypothetical protein [Spirochaetales bacterium]